MPTRRTHVRLGRDIDARHHNRDATGPPTGWTQDLCFQTCPRRVAVKLPVTALHLARPVSRRKKAMQRDRPTRFGPLRQAALASRPDPRVGHIHSSRCRTTRSGQGPSDAPAGRTSGEFLFLRTGSRASMSGAPVCSTVPLRPTARGDGGARRDRTDDLMLAKHALYRLSYCPDGHQLRCRPRINPQPRAPASDWWAWEDSNFRPHAYQARALTN